MDERFALKKVDETEKTVTFKGRGVVFGGVDLYGDTFTADTNFYLDTIAKSAPLMYDHGFNEIMGARTFGNVTLIPSEAELFVQCEMDKTADYWAFIGPLLEANSLGLSTGSVSHLVEYAADGHTILSWPIAEVSLTPEPAEPRTFEYQQIKSYNPAVKGFEPTEVSGKDTSADNPDDNLEDTQADNLEDNKADGTPVKANVRTNMDGKGTGPDMDIRDTLNALKADLERLGNSDEEIRAKVNEVTGTLEKIKNASYRGYSVDPGSNEDPGRRDPNAGWKSLGRSLKGVRAGDLGMVRAAGINEAVQADGGFFVGQTIGQPITETIFELSDFLGKCRELPVPVGNEYVMDQFDEYQLGNGNMLGGITVYNVGEGKQITDSKPSAEKFKLQLGKKAALMYDTNESSEDAPMFANTAKTFIPRAIQYLCESELFSGTGVGDQFLGILNAPATITTAKETGQAAGTIIADNILKMLANFHTPSLGNAVWVANPKALPQLVQLFLVHGTSGTPMWVNGDFSKGIYSSLMGIPLYFSDHCEELGSKGDLYLVDWGHYGLATKGNVKEAESVHVRFLYDETAYRFTYRINGKPLIRTYYLGSNGSDKYSPFVTLAERA